MRNPVSKSSFLVASLLAVALSCALAPAFAREATPLVHFNRATALEDVGRPHQAVAAYERALALDPRLADAHYNLGVLLEQLGDHQGSLRHLNAYRRQRP